jgi:protein-L-isoaspartate(D-aspartate) O-methyltransferase
MMIDYAVQRANMIESQIRPNGITDARLIAAMAEIPREAFVPPDRQALAYMDEDLPLGWDSFGRRRFLIEPMSLGRLIQMAVIDASDSVLDVGCATGYSTAILSRVAKRVIAIEDDPTLAEFAMQTFRALGLDRIEVVVAAPALGHPALAPYQAIIVNGRLRRVPDELVRQLAPAGRLAAAIGEGVTSPATVLTRAGQSWSSRREFDMFVPAAAGFPDSDGGFAF